MVKTADKIEEEIRAIFSGDTPWVTIVWDDPVNLQTYVVYVFMELFGYSKARATELMLKVHNEEAACKCEHMSAATRGSRAAASLVVSRGARVRLYRRQ